MKTQRNYTIRTMTREQLDMAVEWAATEGWNPGLHDADCYYTADPNGFLMGFLDDEPIASISVVKYDDSFGFLGFYIVKPEYRGQGYGIQIWNAGLQYLNGCNIGLDGVVDQQPNYKKAGFKLAYRHIRFEGKAGGDFPQNSELKELSSLQFSKIEKYEQPFFPTNRSEFVECWINQPGSFAFGVVKNNQLLGYGVIRPCRNGYKIGPLQADSPEQAELLFCALKSKVKAGVAIFLDVPEVNEQAILMARKYNMKLSFETARMYTGSFPELPIHKIFGVTSFEVG